MYHVIKKSMERQDYEWDGCRLFLIRRPGENLRYLDELTDEELVVKDISEIAVFDYKEKAAGRQWAFTIPDFMRFVAVNHPGKGVKISSSRTFMNRLRCGWTFEEILTTPADQTPKRIWDHAIVEGTNLTYSEAEALYDVPAAEIERRVRVKMPMEKLFDKYPKKGAPGRIYECNGEGHTIREWAEISGIPSATLRQRLLYGWPIGEALGTPVARIRRNYSPAPSGDAGPAEDAQPVLDDPSNPLGCDV